MTAVCVADMELVRARRSYSVKVAAHLSKLSQQIGLPLDDQVQWDSLSVMPQWCIASLEDRQRVQRICGAVYMAPAIKKTIDGTSLRKLRKFLGAEIFYLLRNSGDQHHIAHVNKIGKYPEVDVMATGSAVLLKTLPQLELVKLYERIIGPPCIDICSEMAHRVYSVATRISDRITSDNFAHPATSTHLEEILFSNKI